MNSLARQVASRARLVQRARFARLYSSDHSTRPPQHAPAATSVGLPDGESATQLDVKGKAKGLPLPYDLPFPDLLEPEPLYDLVDGAEFRPTKQFRHPTKLIVRNDPSLFVVDKEEAALAAKEQEEFDEDNDKDEDEEEESPMNHLALSRREIGNLHIFPLISRRVVQQTGKGKIARQAALVVVGNGNGLVGYGEGKDDETLRAIQKAEIEAIRNMDYVDRFEQRTIWTEMESKMGATRIILRPRPLGFGLHCNPNVHQVLKAAGIKDISAKVWGSRNPLNVIKLLFRMLHAGNAPLAMGDGIGGRGRKLDKGSGVRGKQEIERERGRKLVNLRTR
ncbi:hypothetical protein FA95DRAFT_1553751 [Auriscalpium vulgare]|uniref:Uncharacterized protein n=1 Tax=Auriscalpium vulgare TaxID=40419 RepID=A0ACB8S718_9AGAM|nr:hypothetical protein FA95DRAFT_1553751 [Auriscalpium vulgare]